MQDARRQPQRRQSDRRRRDLRRAARVTAHVQGHSSFQAAAIHRAPQQLRECSRLLLPQLKPWRSSKYRKVLLRFRRPHDLPTRCAHADACGTEGPRYQPVCLCPSPATQVPDLYRCAPQSRDARYASSACTTIGLTCCHVQPSLQARLLEQITTDVQPKPRSNACTVASSHYTDRLRFLPFAVAASTPRIIHFRSDASVL
jgi:hypothetical protein